MPQTYVEIHLFFFQFYWSLGAGRRVRGLYFSKTDANTLIGIIYFFWSHELSLDVSVRLSLKGLYDKTRMHSSRMRTARSSSRPGGSPQAPVEQTPPGANTLWEQTLPPGADTPQEQTNPSEQTPPVDRITDACENITLPQLRCGW